MMDAGGKSSFKLFYINAVSYLEGNYFQVHKTEKSYWSNTKLEQIKSSDMKIISRWYCYSGNKKCTRQRYIDKSVFYRWV
jgi:hypothetical protein